jgi:membrane fusion protein, multidrug efflux system
MAEENHTDPMSDAPKETPLESGAGKAPSGDRRTRRMARTSSRMRWIAAIVLMLLVVGGIWLWRYMGSYESTDDAQVDGHLSPVSARVSGYVTQVDVNDNQYVKKGQVLVQIDPRDYQVAVERAEAELADAEATARALGLNVPVTSVGTITQVSSAEAEVDAAQASVAAARHQADAARAQLQQAEADDARAQADLERYGTLVRKNEVSQQIYDHAVATAKATAASVEAARAALSAAQQAVKVAQGRLAQAQATLRYSHTGPQQVAATRARAQSALAVVQQKRAALDQAKLNLQYCTVVAPITGVVSKNVEVGMNVQPGQPLLTIADLDDVWITANFKETQLADMHPGQRVTISVDAYARDYDGRVNSIAGASGSRFSLLPPENATGNYVKVVQRIPVKIVLDPGQNKDHRLRLGMSVEPKVWLR